MYSKSDKPVEIILGPLQPVHTLTDFSPKIHINIITIYFLQGGRFRKFPQQSNV